MPKASKQTASQVEDMGVMEGRYEELGGYTVGFETFREDADATPLFKGLPDDRCQCPHWGYVVSGKVTFRYADRDEVYETGDAFYTPPGHIPVKHEPGSEVVMFSPSEELKKTEAVMAKNMEAM